VAGVESLAWGSRHCRLISHVQAAQRRARQEAPGGIGQGQAGSEWSISTGGTACRRVDWRAIVSLFVAQLEPTAVESEFTSEPEATVVESTTEPEAAVSKFPSEPEATVESTSEPEAAVAKFTAVEREGGPTKAAPAKATAKVSSAEATSAKVRPAKAAPAEAASAVTEATSAKADALNVEPAVAIAAATNPMTILRIMVLTPSVRRCTPAFTNQFSGSP
jgi:hypothetical protein